MKYLGHIRIALLKEGEYKELFPPLSESEYADLRERIKKAGIVKNLIVEEAGDGYAIVSGHAMKAIAQELGIENVPCLLAETPGEIAEALVDRPRLVKLAQRYGPLDPLFDEDDLHQEALLAILIGLRNYRASATVRMTCSAYLRWSLRTMFTRKLVHTELERLREAVPEEARLCP
ncbi:MAG: ParB/RepB/Spo0J family partition protein [Syntrophorhabdales bacterium]|jgi:hypothetical protein